MLYSFDVFDTLITRTTATPQGVFLVMQKILMNDSGYACIDENIKLSFAELRIHAEELARNRIQRNGIEDVTIDEIYEYLAMRGGLGKAEIELLKELEVHTEYDLSIGIAGNIARVKQLVDDGEHVVLISDMYLPHDVIQKLLIKADPVFEGISLYVSNDYRKIKFSGNLYRLVASKEEASFDEWIHCGDNPRGDIEGAKRLGISVDKYDYPSMTEAEKYLLETHRMDINVQLVVGTSRNSRLSLENDNTANKIGSSIGGMLLVPYVEWIMEESIKKGIERLYFIARDGYILKKIADIIIQNKKLSISTNYIYGSRKAWRMASIDEDNHDVKGLLDWSHYNKLRTIEELADVFQLEESELKAFLPVVNRDDDYINALNRKRIMEALCVPDFYRFLIGKHKEKRDLTVRYLKENIDAHNDKFAFVELAGSGYTQICLAHLMKSIFKGRIKSFYYKMDMLQNNTICDFYTFFPSRLKQHILIEVLCHAPHGQTSGYIDGNKVSPRLESYEDEAIIKHGINDYIAGIEAFTRERYKNSDLPFIRLDVIRTIYDYLNTAPDTETLDFIADMPNSVTGRENEVVEYAPKLSDDDINKIFLGSRDLTETYYIGTSLECSVMRCTDEQKKQINWCKQNYNSDEGQKFRAKEKYDSNENSIPKAFIGKKIVVYAAGNRGQAIYRILSTASDSCELLWVDKNWPEKQELGLPVRPIEDILNWQYDYVIITIEDQMVANEAKKDLVKLGISEDEILFM